MKYIEEKIKLKSVYWFKGMKTNYRCVIIKVEKHGNVFTVSGLRDTYKNAAL